MASDIPVSPALGPEKPDGTTTIKERAQRPNNSKPNGPRPKKPNYAQIHSRPLPLDIFPLPAFVPHNPISLLRILYALVSQSVWGPSSRSTIHKGYFSKETQSIHITDPQSIRAFWEAGFFGKGTLSRSEPRWLDQEKRRRGLVALETSEEITRKRRQERRQFKLERARLEREAIEQQLREEGKLKSIETAEVSSLGDEETPETAPELDAVDDEIQRLEEEDGSALPPDLQGPEEEELQDQEFLQLTLEEAFFLIYALGTLAIYKDEVQLSPAYLFRLFSDHSTYPVPEQLDLYHHQLHRKLHLNSSESIPAMTHLSNIQPDNPFIMKYVVYHHFRSLGWAVRPGVKFAVDYLLYNRGPVFSHAEFAVMILPSYSHAYWSENETRRTECEKKEKRDWWWLHRVNRVQSQVHKTLVLVYVDVPPPGEGDCDGNFLMRDVGMVLKRYRVREVVLRRWTPNRNRD